MLDWETKRCSLLHFSGKRRHEHLFGILHSIKSIKAKVVPWAWYVTTAVPGRGGGRAALAQKSIQPSLIPKDFWETLNSQSKEPSEWKTVFASARLAQRVGILNFPKDEGKDEPDLTIY